MKIRSVLPPFCVPGRRLIAAISIAVCAGFGIVPAHAIDIGFGPVDVSVQGFANSGMVRIDLFCDVFAADEEYSISISDFSGLPGYPSTVKLDATGGFSGKLGAGLFLKNPADLSKAVSFKCFLRGDNGNITKRLEIGNGTEWWHIKSGVVSVSGPIN